MGTTVRGGNARGVVVATGGRTAFGAIALGRGERQPETAFQVGLLFSLAIAVGITPQLLPAVVTTSLATGSRRLARRKVLVKRLVGIEDLGNVEVLFTDKTGTLTEGRVTFQRATGSTTRSPCTTRASRWTPRWTSPTSSCSKGPRRAGRWGDRGRRIFANTIKYVLMGTSSNFGNMISAAGASAFLPFLPMLPSQILLNNLLYDAGELTTPTDNVDDELLQRPSRWDLPFIERFMLVFGPASSLFDFVTFALMLGVFHAGPAFRSGWFVESIATQTLVVFVIRTRRVPFWLPGPASQLPPRLPWAGGPAAVRRAPRGRPRRAPTPWSAVRRTPRAATPPSDAATARTRPRPRAGPSQWRPAKWFAIGATPATRPAAAAARRGRTAPRHRATSNAAAATGVRPRPGSRRYAAPRTGSWRRTVRPPSRPW
jgi:magnesium-transporting ATPase (P-type)